MFVNNKNTDIVTTPKKHLFPGTRDCVNSLSLVTCKLSSKPNFALKSSQLFHLILRKITKSHCIIVNFYVFNIPNKLRGNS